MFLEIKITIYRIRIQQIKSEVIFKSHKNVSLHNMLIITQYTTNIHVQIAKTYNNKASNEQDRLSFKKLVLQSKQHVYSEL